MTLVTYTPEVLSHESLPLYVELQEISAHSYQVQWKTPISVPLANAPSVLLPETCDPTGTTRTWTTPDGFITRARYRCEEQLGGESIRISYTGPNPSVATLLRYGTIAGPRYIAFLGPQETTWDVPLAQDRLDVARQYARSGVWHVLCGADHLLFLICLLWIAGTWHRTLMTITGFTLAHSATLVMSTLNIMRLPVPPIEVSIALSIVLLANELVHGPRRSLTWRYPVAVSTSFGLLHGFGFASALNAIGLPQTDLPTALLSFNLGVEFGQILVAASAIGLMRVLQRARSEPFMDWLTPQTVRTVTGYIVGSQGVFWAIHRGLQLL